MNTSFVNDLVIVTIEDGNRPGNVVDTKVVIKSKIKDFASEAVVNHGKNIILYNNKAYIAFDGSIAKGEYLGCVDLDLLLNY
jgi:hypothetical protein